MSKACRQQGIGADWTCQRDIQPLSASLQPVHAPRTEKPLLCEGEQAKSDTALWDTWPHPNLQTSETYQYSDNLQKSREKT